MQGADNMDEIARPAESPLFTVYDDELLWVQKKPPSPDARSFKFRLPSIEFKRFTYDDGAPVKSILEAEDFVLLAAADLQFDQIAQEIDREYHLNSLLDRRRDLTKLPYNIISACTLVGQVSRRGAGNHVLMHPTMFETLMGHQTVKVERVELPPAGRWTPAGSLSNLRIFTGTVLPANEIVAFYRNVNLSAKCEDGPAAVIRDDNKGLSLVIGLDKIYRFAIPAAA
jgi:hypothetical protein